MAKTRQDGSCLSVTHWIQPAGRVSGLLRLACGLAALGIAPIAAQTATETVLHNFTTPPKGANPYASVIRDAAGNLYGTTNLGGASGAGVVFKVDTSGQPMALYSFTGRADGGYPQAGVIRDAVGNLYGTTTSGGTGNRGVVYMLDTAGHETVLYSFTGGADGGYPQFGVTRDSAGNLYGTSDYGATGGGVVYKVDPAGQETVLYNFTGGADGSAPSSGVIRDALGNLYGTTYGGGRAGAGVVFKVDAAGQETALHSFTGGADGGNPIGGVILDPAGNLYGTTDWGGNANWGVVYKLDAKGRETVLYNFTGGADGGLPYAGVIRDPLGNLYGTTLSGGSAGWGTVYTLDATGQETVLHNFTGGADGGDPYAGVVRDAAGNLYGTAYYGGSADAGVVYMLDAAGQQTVLCSFPPAEAGSYPATVVMRDSAGNFYGTTGGAANAGIVYKLGAAGQETVLYSFTGGADGGHPYAGVIEDSAGNLYGTTYSGGAANAGVVYKLDSAGNETALYSFTGGADGGNPYSGVISDSSGNLYGTTFHGGATGFGAVYELDASGQETVLYSFTGGADGANPYSGVISDSSGNLYGTTQLGGTSGAGVVYKLDTAGNETPLYSFTGGADGGNPYSGVILDSSGNLYGTTHGGGAAGWGVVYKVDTAGQETVLYSFTGGSDGGYPGAAGVVRDAAGNLYGTTYYGGGPANAGAVYMLNKTGLETVLYSFTDELGGGYPSAGVILDAAGNLYGTATYGGSKSGGVVFKLVP